MPHTPCLTADECQFFRDNGYVGPFRAVSVAEMTEMRHYIDSELLQTDGPNPHNRLQSRHMDSALIRELACHPAVIDRMASLYGDDLIAWATYFFNKDPGGKEIPWHQDLSYWPLEPMINISAWIAVDHVTRENSCVRLIPGSHKSVVPSIPATDDMAFATMADTATVDLASAVEMELEPGEFFLFNEKTLHQSDANTSDRRRMGMTVRVTLPLVAISQDGPPLHPGHRAVLVRGRDAFGLNRLMLPDGRNL
jgi:ectoine hydroxylase-related dioxygenase (phytanoyl-CoA dioxygenase family)